MNPPRLAGLWLSVLLPYRVNVVTCVLKWRFVQRSIVLRPVNAKIDNPEATRTTGHILAVQPRGRAQTAALDRGLALVGLWLRDVACVADGAPELAHHRDRLAELHEDAALGQGAARLRGAQGLVEETRASLQFNPSEELALDALGSRLARTLRG